MFRDDDKEGKDFVEASIDDIMKRAATKGFGERWWPRSRINSVSIYYFIARGNTSQNQNTSMVREHRGGYAWFLRSIVYFTLCFFFFSIPLIFFALSFSLFLIIVVTQIRGHILIAGSSPPSPLQFVPCIFFREKISALACLIDNCACPTLYARRAQQMLILFFSSHFC